MAQTYRVAVFGRTGKGNYGHGVDICWLDHPQTKVVAVADDDDAGRADAAERLGVEQTFADYRRMLDEVKPDILAICPRWVDQHRDAAVAAAERGIHMFMEKPFCRTPQEADEIVAACERTHTKLAIAHPTRYSPIVDTVRRLLKDGAIGRVLELRIRGKEDRRGGGEDLWVLGSHMLDLSLALGYEPQWCFSSVLQDGQPLRREHVSEGAEGLGPLAGDAVRATYGLKQGITMTVQSYRNMAGSPSRYGLQIYGSEGILEIVEGTLPQVHILQDSSWSPGRSGKSWQLITTAGIGQPEPLTGEKVAHRHLFAVDDLLSAIENHREPKCNMYEARRVVEMIAATFESQRIGGPVTFPLETRVNPLTLL
ncbi:MAG: Gfo/Idh/MocA family protein [Planctomycetaceae bacterium]